MFLPCLQKGFFPSPLFDISVFPLPRRCHSNDISPYATTPVPIILILLTSRSSMYQFYSVAGIDAQRVEIGSDRNGEYKRERGERTADAGWEVGAGASPREQPHFHRSCECRGRGRHVESSAWLSRCCCFKIRILRMRNKGPGVDAGENDGGVMCGSGD